MPLFRPQQIRRYSPPPQNLSLAGIGTVPNVVVADGAGAGAGAATEMLKDSFGITMWPLVGHPLDPQCGGRGPVDPVVCFVLKHVLVIAVPAGVITAAVVEGALLSVLLATAEPAKEAEGRRGGSFEGLFPPWTTVASDALAERLSAPDSRQFCRVLAERFDSLTRKEG